MKTVISRFALIFLFSTVYVGGCSKSDEESVYSPLPVDLSEPETFPFKVNLDSILQLEVIAPLPFPVSGKYNCAKPGLYHDSIFYNLGNAKSDFIVKSNVAPGSGKFFSWPMGLVIDSLTGSINVSASSPGYRYTVGYVKSGSRDTCLMDIVLAGASYKDQIYVLGQSDTLAFPYFNGEPSGPSPCDTSDDNDYPEKKGKGNSKCEFDAEDAAGRHGRANKKNVKVRTISGIINLKKTLEEGAFGSSAPSNGQSIVVPVYYKLNDRGAKALQKINVQLLYFDRKEDIPVSLLSYMGRKRSRIDNRYIISPNGNPRPPLIVITRS